jgi:hypothetical protein
MRIEQISRLEEETSKHGCNSQILSVRKMDDVYIGGGHVDDDGGVAWTALEYCRWW